jgi:hypothetical protein
MKYGGFTAQTGKVGSQTFKVKPVNTLEVHMHRWVTDRRSHCGTAEDFLEVSSSARYLHDRLHEDAVFALPHRSCVTAMVVHCTPCTPMYTRLHNTRSVLLDTAVFRQRVLCIVLLLHVICSMILLSFARECTMWHRCNGLLSMVLAPPYAC